MLSGLQTALISIREKLSRLSIISWQFYLSYAHMYPHTQRYVHMYGDYYVKSVSYCWLQSKTIWKNHALGTIFQQNSKCHYMVYCLVLSMASILWLCHFPFSLDRNHRFENTLWQNGTEWALVVKTGGYAWANWGKPWEQQGKAGARTQCLSKRT